MQTPDEKRQQFGHRVRELRMARGMSQPALAAALADEGHDVTHQAVSGWERGEFAPRFPAIVEALERCLDAEGELVRLLGFAEGEALVERVSSLEQRVAALEAGGSGPRRRGR